MAPRHLPSSGPAITPKPATPHAPSAAPIKSTVSLPPPPIKPSSPLPVPSALRPPTTPSPLPPPPSAPLIKPLQPSSAVGAPKSPAAVPAAPAPQPHAGAPVQPLVLPLAPLTSGWPDAIKQALAELSDPTVSLPADELEQAMKRGKILFPWTTPNWNCLWRSLLRCSWRTKGLRLRKRNTPLESRYRTSSPAGQWRLRLKRR